MVNEYVSRKRQLLVQIQQELDARSKAWETLCSLPEFKVYAEMRESLQNQYKKLDEQKAKLDVLKKEYDKIPEIEGNIVSLWFKLLKTKMKYRRNKKYKAVLKIEQAKYNYETKKLKRKTFYGEMYEVNNQYEITKALINRIQSHPTYSYFESMRHDIKSGEDFDRYAIDMAVYAKKPFDAKKYSYKALTEFKQSLKNAIKSDEMISNL